jgi:hypothetical protein
MGMGRTRLATGDELRPDDGHLARRLDPQAHLAGLQPDHSDADVVADVEPLHQLPGQYQHL